MEWQVVLLLSVVLVGGQTPSAPPSSQPSTPPTLSPVFPCSDGPWPGTADPLADYSECNSASTPTCSVGCPLGYRPDGVLALACTSTFRNYDAGGVRCRPNSCTDGPLWNVDRRANYTNCSLQRTGELCLPECKAGYNGSTGGFVLQCLWLTGKDNSNH
eukprot:Hpha_TRINITY_DN25174_c0_g1::TRINITY_DN25174_c0_g1_i1::g.139352::m.139352